MLETERLIIRLGKKEDVLKLLEIRNSSFVMKYNPMKIANEEALLKEISHEFVLERKNDHKIIGCIGVQNDFLRYGVESKCISYYLDEKETRKGYMSEGLSKVLSYLFDEGAEVVCARVFVGNEASVSLLKKLGFHQEGILRHAVKSHDGIVYDDQLFTLLKQEWNKKSIRLP